MVTFSQQPTPITTNQQGPPRRYWNPSLGRAPPGYNIMNPYPTQHTTQHQNVNISTSSNGQPTSAGNATPVPTTQGQQSMPSTVPPSVQVPPPSVHNTSTSLPTFVPGAAPASVPPPAAGNTSTSAPAHVPNTAPTAAPTNANTAPPPTATQVPPMASTQPPT